MPQSLHRTWVALAIAAFAVLAVAFLSARDFARDVYPECPGALVMGSHLKATYQGAAVDLEAADGTSRLTGLPVTSGRSFRLLYDEKKTRGYGVLTQYDNVRLVWTDAALDGTRCTCGSIPITLSGEAPSDLRLFHVGSPYDNTYMLKGRSVQPTGKIAYDDDDSIRTRFTIYPGDATRRLQTDRIVERRHLSGAVVLVALGALVVALFRSRRAMSYALRIHEWTPARLTPEGLIESESGETLGTLEQTRLGRIAPGPILVAPEALFTSGLYRDMPIIQRRSVAEGTHERWAAGTMLRLRDARVLAVLSTACTVLAFGARLIA